MGTKLTAPLPKTRRWDDASQDSGPFLFSLCDVTTLSLITDSQFIYKINVAL